MANLTGTNTYDDVYQLETTDPVLGGPGGIANRQSQQLLNRTVYLKAILDAIQVEIIAARNGTASLDTRLDALDVTVAAKAELAEIIAARNGTASLDTRLDALDVTVASNVAEVTAARNGTASLDTRLDALDVTVAAKAELAEIIAARNGTASLDTRLDALDVTVAGKALLAGSGTQTFSVATPTSGAHAPRLDQFAASLGASGYQKLPGGFILQWGRYGSPVAEGTYSVNFAIAFPSACVCVIPVVENNTAASTNDVHAQVKDFSTTTANIFINHSPGGGVGSDVGTGFSWMAIGY